MLTVHTVTHCYCPPGLDIYAQHLKWQFASIWHEPPLECLVRFTVFYCESDAATSAMVNALRNLRLPKRMSFEAAPLPESKLFRRAIGRNQIADIVGTSDVVHFADVDYLYSKGFADSIAQHVSPYDSLVVPESYMICRTHQIGDELVSMEAHNELPFLTMRNKRDFFEERKVKAAIGGIQIIGGRELSRIGYLRGTKWVEPVTIEAGFRSCRCDKKWRQVNSLQSSKRPLAKLYRLRHTRDGRDYDLSGTKRGKEVW